MEHEQEYRGHEVVVWTSDASHGRSVWAYSIDGQHFKQNDDSPLPNEALAMKEGLTEALRAIDRKLDGQA